MDPSSTWLSSSLWGLSITLTGEPRFSGGEWEEMVMPGVFNGRVLVPTGDTKKDRLVH